MDWHRAQLPLRQWLKRIQRFYHDKLWKAPLPYSSMKKSTWPGPIICVSRHFSSKQASLFLRPYAGSTCRAISTFAGWLNFDPMTRSMVGCPLARVNHALAMNEKDFINLMHDVERHEDAVTEDAKEIRELKVDVWELSNLVRLLAAFVPRPVSGMVEEKAAIEFETQLQAILQKHGIERWTLSGGGIRYFSPEPPRASLHLYAKRS